MNGRGARFDVLEDEVSEADYIVLDIPTHQLAAVAKKLKEVCDLAEAMEGTGKPADPNDVFPILLVVKAHHPSHLTYPNPGQPGVVKFLPSLLTRKIPRG